MHIIKDLQYKNEDFLLKEGSVSATESSVHIKETLKSKNETTRCNRIYKQNKTTSSIF